MSLGGLVFAFDGDEFYGDLPTVIQYYHRVSQVLLRKGDTQSYAYLQIQFRRFLALSLIVSGSLPVLFVPFAYRSKERLYLISTQTLSVFMGTRTAGDAGRVSDALYKTLSSVPNLNQKAYYFLHAFVHEYEEDLLFIGSALEEPDDYDYES